MDLPASQNRSSIFVKRSDYLVRPGSPSERTGKPLLPCGFGLKPFSPSPVAPIYHSPRFASRPFRMNGRSGWIQSSWISMHGLQRIHSERSLLPISRDYRPATWRIEVRWWQKSGAAPEKQVLSGSSSVSIGRQSIRAPETTGNKIWSASKIYSMPSQLNPTSKIILHILLPSILMTAGKGRNVTGPLVVNLAHQNVNVLNCAYPYPYVPICIYPKRTTFPKWHKKWMCQVGRPGPTNSLHITLVSLSFTLICVYPKQTMFSKWCKEWTCHLVRPSPTNSPHTTLISLSLTLICVYPKRAMFPKCVRSECVNLWGQAWQIAPHTTEQNYMLHILYVWNTQYYNIV